MSFQIYALHTADAIKPFEDLEREVWGLSDRDVVPVAHMVAAVHAGGIAAGAFHEAKMVGFVYGFPSYQPDWSVSVGLHSHMLAVLPEYRGLGIGQKMKWFQRDWCLARGLSWMTWTFDPAQQKNAKLNVQHLGAVASIYRENEYGVMGGGLNGDLPSDRLLAFWDLASERVERCAAGKLEPLPQDVAVALASVAGRPAQADLSLVARFIRVALPESLNLLLVQDFDLALLWRLQVREVLQAYLAKGYVISGFAEGSYILEDLKRDA